MVPDALSVRNFDLYKTLYSGQVFHWMPHREGFLGAVEERLVYLEQSNETLLIDGADHETVVRYLALDHPMKEIIGSFPDDEVMRLALQFSSGIRIIRQPPWECLATFLMSAIKQVSHIRAISLAIRKRFGRRLLRGELSGFSFPGPEKLASTTLEQLLECKLGFRAQNLLASARMIESGEIDLESIRKMPTEEARAGLLRCPGVGEKIANCVLLFAYERLDTIPIDVWIARILSEVYFKGRKKISRSEMKVFAASYFGAYGGYAQQYLFHHWRLTYRKRG
jgi:N-glycosylase/DNA lyase